MSLTSRSSSIESKRNTESHSVSTQSIEIKYSYTKTQNMWHKHIYTTHTKTSNSGANKTKQYVRSDGIDDKPFLMQNKIKDAVDADFNTTYLASSHIKNLYTIKL